jgi:CHAD domain-containing protein
VEVGELLSADLARAVADFRNSDGPVVGGLTPDAIHDARVALRRIRSNLRTFRRLLDPGWSSAARGELAWYESVLGGVRDLDVTGARLLGASERLDDRKAVAAITALLATERAARLADLQAGRASPRYSATLAYLAEAATRPPLRERARLPARKALLPYLERPWRDLRAAAGAVRGADADAALHVVRIRAKQLRYAAELATPVLGPDATRLARAAAGLQRHLGVQRDAVLATSWLEHAAEEAPEAAFLCGQLAAEQEAFAEEQAASWGRREDEVRRAWRRLAARGR